MSADSKKYLLIILVLYCLVRIPLIFSNQLLSDELDIGAIAKEFVTKAPHLPIPLLDYVKRPYALTSLLDAAFAAPFFLMFGDTLFALKLASLVWYVFPLIAWWFVWRSDFSPKKTCFILLFFVLSPEMVFYSLTYGHQHLETMLWVALTLILYKRFLHGKLGGEVQGGLLLGLFGGLVASLSLANGVTLALLCLHLLFLKEINIKKPVFFGIAVPMFLIGISPLIVYNVKFGMTGYFEMKEIFTRADISFGHFFQRFAWVFTQGIPGLFVFKKFPLLPKFILTGFFSFFYFFSLICLVWKKRKSLLTFQDDKGFDIVAFGLTYQMLFITLALTSSRIYGKELFFPMAPFIGITLGLGAFQFAGTLGTAWKTRLGTCLALFAITMWILGDLSLIRFKKLGEAFHIKGYSYMILTQQLACRFNHNEDPAVARSKLSAFLEGRPPETKRRLAFAASNCLPAEPAAGREFLLSIQPIFHEHPSFNLGREIVWKWLEASKESFQPAAVINRLELEEWNWLETTVLADFSISLNPEEKKWFNRGVKEGASWLVEDDFLRKMVVEKLSL